MSALEAPTEALVSVAVALNDADQEELTELMRDAREDGAPGAWLEELVLNALLLVGFPRALVAAAALRTVQPLEGELGDAADYSRWQDWAQRGEATCRAIYGKNYERLRANLHALHPALEAWVIMDGYGRTISRPGLDAKRRELCTIAILAPQGVPAQLHSHLRGALNVGATPEEVDEVLDIVTGWHGERLVADARAQWKDIRERS